MPSEFTISLDLPCFYCDYNLRGLSYHSICPECGNPVKLTFKAITLGLWGTGEELQQIRTLWVKDVASAVGYPASALLFVIDAVRLLTETQAKQLTDSGEPHYTARDVCDAFRRYAEQCFNSREEALDLLAEWKLNRSEDLGRIVFALCEGGFLKASPDDTLSDFDGIFTLPTLFPDEQTATTSPLNVQGVNTDLSMEEIVAYLRQAKERQPPA